MTTTTTILLLPRVNNRKESIQLSHTLSKMNLLSIPVKTLVIIEVLTTKNLLLFTLAITVTGYLPISSDGLVSSTKCRIVGSAHGSLKAETLEITSFFFWIFGYQMVALLLNKCP